MGWVLIAAGSSLWGWWRVWQHRVQWWQRWPQALSRARRSWLWGWHGFLAVVAVGHCWALLPGLPPAVPLWPWLGVGGLTGWLGVRIWQPAPHKTWSDWSMLLLLWLTVTSGAATATWTPWTLADRTALAHTLFFPSLPLLLWLHLVCSSLLLAVAPWTWLAHAGIWLVPSRQRTPRHQ